MSMSLSAKCEPATSRASLSPSFARKLSFTNDETNDLQTPQTTSRSRSNANLSLNPNKENALPQTPMSTAQDSQYKTWLQNNGFVDIFRNPNVLAAIIKALRVYSAEVMHKVQQLLDQNNELQAWRVEIGEPALETIERYKVIEAELKSAQVALNAQYEAKKAESEQSQNDFNLLKLRIKEQLLPRIAEYEALMKQNETLMHQMDGQKTENNNLKEKLLLQKEEHELQMQQQKHRSGDTNAAAKAKPPIQEELPPQFMNEDNKTQFDWDFALDEEDDEEEEEEIPPPEPQMQVVSQRGDEFRKYCDMVDKSLHTLTAKIEHMNNGHVQTISHSLRKHFSSNIQQQKLHNSEFAKLNQSLLKVHEKQLGILDMKSTMTSLYSSLNTSLSSINASSIFCNNTDNDIQQKLDRLTAYIRCLKLDQRIITVYKKLNGRMDESATHLQNIENTQNTLAFGQESQQKLIDNSLATFRELFETEFIEIGKAVKGIKTEINEQQLEPPQPVTIFDDKFDKPLSPIGKSIESPFDADTLLNAIHTTRSAGSNYNEVIDIKCNRLNEMIISEFVLVLIDHLSTASQEAFNKLFVIIRNIIHQLVSIQWQSIKSVVFKDETKAAETVTAVMLTQYKTDVDVIFKNIFQNTINNVLNELIANKMDRLKVQSKVAKLQSKMTINNQNNANMNNAILQVEKISFKQMYFTLLCVALGVFLIGVFIGCFFVSSGSLFPSHQHHVSHSFMS
eukprot:1019716_1